MSLSEEDTRFQLWEASYSPSALFPDRLTISEFTISKQTWQQSKADSYLAKAGETIVPGFTGVYHK